MDMLENIRLAINSVLANKLRALLTMLGIIIGIGSVIAIVTVGDSMAGSMNEELSGFGGRNVTVGVQQKQTAVLPDESGIESAQDYYYQEPAAPNGDDFIMPAMVADYQRVFSAELEAVSLSENLGTATLTRGRAKADVEIYGVNPGYFKVEKLELKAGRFLTEKDSADARYLAMVSDKFVAKYWGSSLSEQEAVGQSLLVETGGRVVRLYISGVYHAPENSAYSFGGETTTKLLMPITLAKRISAKNAGYNSIVLVPKAEVKSDEFLKQTNTFFASYYTRNKTMTAVASSNESFLKSMNDMMNKLKLGIGAIAAISLLVGGIGVMNIMMVSVTERTREIGIRMALGAKGRVILFQFIVEAMLICLLGGIIGVALGVSLGSLGASIMQYPARPSMVAILVAVGFSLAIGLFFGYYPAKRAARLDPIEALGYE